MISPIDIGRDLNRICCVLGLDNKPRRTQSFAGKIVCAGRAGDTSTCGRTGIPRGRMDATARVHRGAWWRCGDCFAQQSLCKETGEMPLITVVEIDPDQEVIEAFDRGMRAAGRIKDANARYVDRILGPSSIRNRS